MKNVIASQREWNKHLPEHLSATTGQEFVLVDRVEDLTRDKLNQINPRYVFVPHWSKWIPSDVFENFETIIFHMTEVPFGRGGSPLQNLIARGIYETKISALRCVREMDAGAVYTTRPLSLYGSAEEIYMRANDRIEEMILEIVTDEPDPERQVGEATIFFRRKPEDGDLGQLGTIRQVFDTIRMLDAPGYPKAFIEVNALRIEFNRATLTSEGVIADARITVKEKA